MARTTKSEHPTDGIHICWKIERQSRPAGRLLAIIRDEMDAEGGDDE